MATDESLAIVAPSTRAAAPSPLSASALPKYLVGSRDVIVQIAESSAALWVGLLFVLSAGFAREYDGVDLLRESWHLALPLVASLGTSFILYLLIFFAARNRGVKELQFWSGYRTLLTFYWWTAPLAWLYAIPVERFMTPGDATVANLWLLAIVSAWRVLLITRAAAVWLNTSYIAMLFIVIFFADTVTVVAAFASPKPIFDVMGGVRLSEADSVVLSVTMSVMFFGGVSWFVWLIAAKVVVNRKTPPWRLAATLDVVRRVSTPLWVVAAIFLLMGFAVLPFGQPAQQRRFIVEKQLYNGELDAAVEYAAEFSRNDFPPVWDPPPRLGYGKDRPSPIDVLEAIEKHNGPEWLREIYVGKLAQDPSGMLWRTIDDASNADPVELERVFNILEKNVPAKSISVNERHDLESMARLEAVDPQLRERLRAYLEERSDDDQSSP